METLNQDKLKVEKIDSNQFLSPLSTRGKGKEKDLSDIDWNAGFSGESINVPINHQDQTHIVDRTQLERGGLNSNQLIKSTWNNATVSNPNGPINENDEMQKATNLKTAELQSYPTWSLFGFRPPKNLDQFTATDVVSSGRSSSKYGNNKVEFNVDAPYLNGSCNKTSQLDQTACEFN